MKPINNLNTLHFLFPTLKLLLLIEGFTAELTTSREGCACTHAHTHKEFAEAARWEVTWFKTIQGSAPARCYTALPSQDLLSTCQDSATCNFQAFRKLPSNPKIPKDYCYGYWRKKKKKKNRRCVIIVFPGDFLAALGLFWHLVILWSKYLWKLLWSPRAEHRASAEEKGETTCLGKLVRLLLGEILQKILANPTQLGSHLKSDPSGKCPCTRARRLVPAPSKMQQTHQDAAPGSPLTLKTPFYLSNYQFSPAAKQG